MKKLAVLAVTSSLIASAFVAGVAVGKAAAPTPKFTAAEEVKWDDMSGLKLGTLFGDYKKGPYGALLKLPAGYTSPMHSHSGTYEAVQISGTSSHWMKGEDGTKAKKMTPGSYWTIPAKAEHVSACASGQECVFFIWQKTKFDATPSKEAAAAQGSGSAAKAGAGTGTGSAAKAGAGSGSAAKAGAAAATGPGTTKASSTGTGSGSATPAKK